MKIAAYTICKNEARHVEAYMDALDALGIPAFVLDTGSTDDTIEKLKARGAFVVSEPYESWSSPEEYKAIVARGGKPFRFDTARNRALELVPEDFDLCMILDLDERAEPACQQLFDLKDIDRVIHQYNADAKNPVILQQDRFHARHGYTWKYIAHEACYRDPGTPPEHRAFIHEVLITHYPDHDRPHSCEHMLRIGVEEHPGDLRMSTMLAVDIHRAAIFELKAGHFLDAIILFLKFIDLPTTGPFDQSYALAMMAKCYGSMFGAEEKQIDCLERAVKAFPRRESIVDLAQAYLDRQWYDDALATAYRAIEVKEGMDMHDADLGAWTYRPWEIAARAAKGDGREPEFVKFIVEKGIKECEIFEHFEQAKAILEELL